MGQAAAKTQDGKRRYPREFVVKAILAVQQGATPADVAADFGVAPNLVTYWVDRAEKYLGEGLPVTSLDYTTGLDLHSRQQFARVGWQSVYLALRVARSKLRDATLQEVTNFVNSTVQLLARHARPTEAERNGKGGTIGPPNQPAADAARLRAQQEAGQVVKAVEATVARLRMTMGPTQEGPQGVRAEPSDPPPAADAAAGPGQADQGGDGADKSPATPT